jgi:antirestriction protein ArdC
MSLINQFALNGQATSVAPGVASERRHNPYQEVTDRIVAELETGALPWVKPWSQTPGRNVPCNAATNRPYSGVNILLLWVARDKGWPTPRFLTFKQATEAGGHVRKGEHGVGVYFVKDLLFKNADAEGDGDERHVRMLKRYVVFNVAQCDDLPDKIITPPVPKLHNRDAPDPLIEEFLATTGAVIREGSRLAVYHGKDDFIALPVRGSFKSIAEFYNTLFHELVHWTGHASRLDRKLDNRFLDPAQRYAAEELIAELGAAFLCAEFSIDGDMRAAGYIADWLKLLKTDAKAIFTAASKAQAAVNYLRQLILAEPAQAAE